MLLCFTEFRRVEWGSRHEEKSQIGKKEEPVRRLSRCVRRHCLQPCSSEAVFNFVPFPLLSSFVCFLCSFLFFGRLFIVEMTSGCARRFWTHFSKRVHHVNRIYRISIQFIMQPDSLAFSTRCGWFYRVLAIEEAIRVFLVRKGEDEEIAFGKIYWVLPVFDHLFLCKIKQKKKVKGRRLKMSRIHRVS